MVACVLIAFGGFAQAETSETNFTILPIPAWVKEITAEVKKEAPPADEETHFLLSDRQINVGTQERFVHVADLILNESGVQNESQLSFEFDPSYEHLVLHRIVIRRGTNSLNRLDRAKIRVIQQERDLDRHLYDGTLSAILFLEDVRIGDVIEYAYTVRGFNPILGGRYNDSFLAQWGVPVDHAYSRIVCPEERKLTVKQFKTDLQPTVTTANGQREYVWESRNLPPVVDEESTPMWDEAYPWIQVTEFRDWTEVVQWALKLYDGPHELDGELREKIEQWKQASSVPEDRLQAALQFVQDEVRYLGIEFGPHSYQPTSPNLVFARRFGDCKDKSFLLCTLLKALEIESVPSLVHTRARHTIAERHPSPTAFDHVVTQARIGNTIFWVDPTRSYQRGPLSARYFPNYGRALLISPDSTGLTVIPRQTNGWPKTTITETFVIKRRKEPAEFTVATIAEGLDAERLRGEFSSSRRDEIEKEYLNYYSQEYPTIKTSRPMQFQDEPDRNVIRLTEHYRVEEFWVLDKEEKYYEGTFYPQTIRSFLEKPDTTIRSTALSFAHPRRQILRTEVLFPEEWPLKNERKTITDTAFKLGITQNYRKQKLVMEYDYESLADSIPVNKVPAHLKNLQRANAALGYTVTWQNEDAPTLVALPEQPNWIVLGIAGLFTIPVMAGAVLIYCYRPTARVPIPDATIEEPLKGLRGWLFVVAFGLIVSPFRIGKVMIESMSTYSLETWHALTVPGGDAYHPLWAPCLIFDLLANITMMLGTILLLVLFFQKRRIFPPLYIGYLFAGLVVVSVDYFAIHAIPAAAAESGKESYRELTRAFIGCAIWVPYMFVSRRVKATFVE